MKAPPRKLRTIREYDPEGNLIRTIEYTKHNWVWFRIHLSAYGDIIHTVPMPPWEVGHIFAAIYQDMAHDALVQEQKATREKSQSRIAYHAKKRHEAWEQHNEWHAFAHTKPERTER